MASGSRASVTKQEYLEGEPSRAPKRYWDSVWQNASLPQSINPQNRSLKRQQELKFHSLFKDIFADHRNSNGATKLLELGCARSVWLPYFSKEFGFHVTGIDYSLRGCDQARAILAREQVDGQVLCADIFQPPPDLLNSLDYVVSLGVVEHFEATDRCLAACAAYLRPGGVMITIIPNMNGVIGLLQKWLGREIYDVHVPLDASALRRAHEFVELNVLRCEYFCALNFGVLNLRRIRQTFLGLWLSRALNALSVATWMLERIGIHFPPNKITSPYIICVAAKKCSRLARTDLAAGQDFLPPTAL